MDASLYGFLAIMVLCGLDCGFSNTGELLDMPEFQHLRREEEKPKPTPPPTLPPLLSQNSYSLGSILNIPTLPRKPRLSHDSKYLQMGLGKRQGVRQLPNFRLQRKRLARMRRGGLTGLPEEEAILAHVDMAALTDALARLVNAGSLEDLTATPGGRIDLLEAAAAHAPPVWSLHGGKWYRNRNRRGNLEVGISAPSRRDYGGGTDPFKYLVGIGK